MDKKFACGDEVKSKASGVFGRIIDDNGHAYKISVKSDSNKEVWFPHDEVVSASQASNEAATLQVKSTQWEPIPRVAWGKAGDAMLNECIKANKPLILTSQEVVNWKTYENLEGLGGLLGAKPMNVKLSPNGRFRYYDNTKNKGYPFKSPNFVQKMNWGDFLKVLNRNSGEEPAAGSREPTKAPRYYLQECLSGHEEMADEFRTWDWQWLLKPVADHNWATPKDVQLWVSSLGAESPLHFDEGENMYVQLRGRKRVVLYPPYDYLNVYPFPCGHPCDRHSMVNIVRYPIDESLQKVFPRFADATGHEALLQPGELLYLPYGWWHYFRSEDNGAVSLNFWYIAPDKNPYQDGKLCLTERLFVRIRRNLEGQVIGQMIEDGKKLPDIMPKLVSAFRSGSPCGETKRYYDVMREILTSVQIPETEKDSFLLEMLDGRFGLDWDLYV